MASPHESGNSLSADLRDWPSVQSDRRWEGLLIGNGASRAVSERFEYKSLFDVAQGPEGRALSEDGAALFSEFDTTNFEQVLRVLSDSARVAQAFEDDGSRIVEAYRDVQTVAFLAMVPALVGLFVWNRRSGGGWFGVTAIIAAIGYAMAGIVNLLEHCFVDTVGFPFTFPLFTGFAEPSPYVLGILLTFFSIPFAMALTRVSFVPTWSAWLLAIGTIWFLAANQQGGPLVLGGALANVGSYLLTHDAPPSQNRWGSRGR